MLDEDRKRQWRNALERLDGTLVRQCLQQVREEDGPDAAVTGIVEDAPHPPRWFVDAWYRTSRRRRQRARYLRLYGTAFLALAAVTAGILYFAAASADASGQDLKSREVVERDWRTRHDSNVRPLPSEGSALSS